MTAVEMFVRAHNSRSAFEENITVLGRERELRGGKGPMWRGVNLGSIGSDNSRMDWNRQGRGNCSRTRRYYLPPRSSK